MRTRMRGEIVHWEYVCCTCIFVGSNHTHVATVAHKINAGGTIRQLIITI